MGLDIKIVNNDWYINPSTNDFDFADGVAQDIQDIVNAFPGWWKENIQIGVGIMNYLGSSGKEQQLSSAIQTMLKASGYTPKSVQCEIINKTFVAIININGQIITITNIQFPNGL